MYVQDAVRDDIGCKAKRIDEETVKERPSFQGRKKPITNARRESGWKRQTSYRRSILLPSTSRASTPDALDMACAEGAGPVQEALFILGILKAAGHAQHATSCSAVLVIRIHDPVSKYPSDSQTWSSPLLSLSLVDKHAAVSHVSHDDLSTDMVRFEAR